jgi:hypothetical protein
MPPHALPALIAFGSPKLSAEADRQLAECGLGVVAVELRAWAHRMP